MADADRKALNSVLIKMGVDEAVATKLSKERALKKISHRMQKQGAPKDLTAEEKKALQDLGHSVDSSKSEAAGDDTKEDVKADEKETEQKPAPAADTKKDKKPTNPKSTKPGAESKTASPKKDKGTGGMAVFKDAFKTRKQYERQELIDKVVKEGSVAKWSVANYISLAKKETSPFGFRLEEVTQGEKKVLKKLEV